MPLARRELLSRYQGQWIGFADGVVIASGTSPVAVFHAAEATRRNPFVTCVGREDEPVRMRRVSFSSQRPWCCSLFVYDARARWPARWPWTLAIRRALCQNLTRASGFPFSW